MKTISLIFLLAGLLLMSGIGINNGQAQTTEPTVQVEITSTPTPAPTITPVRTSRPVSNAEYFASSLAVLGIFVGLIAVFIMSRNYV